jgi:putative oxygen-independent coproporphyrinogen III oxidase
MVGTSFPGLYIHIPFCRTKCRYCNFYSDTCLDRVPAFIEALYREMEMYRGLYSAFDTVYLGGGTPSILSPIQVASILSHIRKDFEILPDAEITMEVNPGDLSPDFLADLRASGINRLNIGIQSFDKQIISFLGRRHTAGEAIASIESARKAGFTNLGIDLIYGIPGQSLASWRDILEQAVSLNPEHLSCYELTIEEGTPLYSSYRTGEFAPLPEDLQYDFFIATSKSLESGGYIHYEVSNFARSGFFSRHNSKYWDHTPYLGLGPAAHSFREGRRWWNHRSLDGYINHLAAGRKPVEDMEILSAELLRLEALYFGFRTVKGIHLPNFTENYGLDILSEKKEMIRKLEKEGLIRFDGTFLKPSTDGMALADSLCLL